MTYAYEVMITLDSPFAAVVRSHRMKTWYENLRAAVKASGMTQQQIAKRVGVTQSAVSQWLRGEAVPKLSHLKALQGVLHMSLDEMLGDVTILERKEERELIAAYRNLTPRERELLRQMLANLLPGKPDRQ